MVVFELRSRLAPVTIRRRERATPAVPRPNSVLDPLRNPAGFAPSRRPHFRRNHFHRRIMAAQKFVRQNFEDFFQSPAWTCLPGKLPDAIESLSQTGTGLKAESHDPFGFPP